MINQPKLAKNGDILITFEDPLDFDEEGELVAKGSPEHVMVLGRLGAGDQRVFLHSAFQSNSQSTVSGVRASQMPIEYKTPGILVFRIKDPILLNNFCKVVEAYAKRVSEQNERKALRSHPLPRRPRDIVASADVYTPTPYSFGRRTNVDEVENLDQWGLYRNIRAYKRYMVAEDPAVGIPEPISKNQGVTCDQFVAYSYMIALIMKLFPNGLPQNVADCFDKFEAERNNRGQHVTQFLDELHFAMNEALEAQGLGKYFSLTCFHVKATNVDRLCTNQFGFNAESHGEGASSKAFDMETIGYLSQDKIGNEMVYVIKEPKEFPALQHASESQEEALQPLLFQAVQEGDEGLFNAVMDDCNRSNNALNEMDKDGRMILDVVLDKADYVKAMKIIKHPGIDPNAKNGLGNTPLMSILIMGISAVPSRLKPAEFHALVKECLDKNPDLQIKNVKGENAISLINAHYAEDAPLKMMLECHVKKIEPPIPAEKQSYIQPK